MGCREASGMQKRSNSFVGADGFLSFPLHLLEDINGGGASERRGKLRHNGRCIGAVSKASAVGIALMQC